MCSPKKLIFKRSLLLLLMGLLTSCSSPKAAPVSNAVDMEKVFSVHQTVPGWAISQPLQVYERENLFNLVDGQAESFFAYGFERVGVERYQNDAGVRLNVEIWQLANPAD